MAGLVLSSMLAILAQPRATAARQGVRRPVLVICRSGAVPVPADRVAELARVLLEPSGFQVVEGRDIATSDFPDQVRRARLLGSARRAAAVAWYRVVRVGGRRVLFLHVLDFLTDKTLVRTVQVSELDWRSSDALARAVALKTWSLLRASFLETRLTRQPVPRAVERLSRLPPSDTARRRVPRSGRGFRLGVRLGYGLGGFSSGVGPYHGPALECLGQLWRRGVLGLWAGIALGVAGHVAVDLGQARVEAGLWPLAGLLELRWQEGRLGLGGGLRAGAMVLAAEASGQKETSLLRWDPVLGGHVSVAWRVWRGLWVYARFVGEAVVAEQCFWTPSGAACFGRARLAGSLGIALYL